MRRAAAAALALAACGDATVNVLEPIGPCGAASALGVEARPADALVDSVVIGTFLHYADTPYNGLAAVTERLRALGVRHVLDPGDNGSHTRAMAVARDARVRFTLSIDPLTEIGTSRDDCAGRPGCRTAGNMARAMGPALEAFSVSSDSAERADPTWVARARDRLRLLRAELDADPATAHVALVGPGADDAREVEALAPLADTVGWAGLGWRFAPGPPGESLDRAFQDYASAYGARPKHLLGVFWFTGTSDGAVGDRVQAKYVTRAVTEAFARRIGRIHIHELLDPKPMWLAGLLREDLRPKPSYEALRRLLALLADDGRAFVPGALDFTLEPAGAPLRHLVLSKASGAYYLVLWREVRSREEDVTVAVDVVLRTRIAEAQLFVPLAGDEPAARHERPTRISVPVPDHPVVLKLTPSCP